jgi:hypothetical protein
MAKQVQGANTSRIAPCSDVSVSLDANRVVHEVQILAIRYQRFRAKI